MNVQITYKDSFLNLFKYNFKGLGVQLSGRELS
jgi:hypothetical protein